MQRAAIIVNPIKVDLPALKRLMRAAERTSGWDKSLWIETSKEDAGGGAAKSALKAKVDLVIVAGGDGTVRAVVEVLQGTSVPVALIPSGTGNLLARNLGLVLDDPAASIEVALNGTDRKIDVGFIELRAPDRSVGRHVFVVMAGVGLDAQMLANTDDKLKAKIGWLAYVGAARKAMRDSGDLRLSYRVDHRRTVSVNANTLMVGNCGTLTGNVPLMPDANLDDGRFEMAILRPTSAFQWIQILGKVFWENGVLRRTKVGTLMTTKDVHALKYVKGREAIVKLDRLEKIELDGDEFGEVTEFSVTMAAAALTVRVTAD